MTILLATNNPHKSEEIRAILADLPELDVRTPSDLGLTLTEPVEDGETLEANAWIKAKEIHDATGLPVIADDTGLEVAALDGAPGVYSARFAGEGATYADNCALLLERMSEAADRSARFRTVICYVDAFRTLFAEGEIEGEIIEEADGEGGFGYDPIFRPSDSAKTFAAMTSAEKNAVSHRARALSAMRAQLERFINDAETHDA